MINTVVSALWRQLIIWWHRTSFSIHHNNIWQIPDTTVQGQSATVSTDTSNYLVPNMNFDIVVRHLVVVVGGMSWRQADWMVVEITSRCSSEVCIHTLHTPINNWCIAIATIFCSLITTIILVDKAETTELVPTCIHHKNIFIHRGQVNRTLREHLVKVLGTTWICLKIQEDSITCIDNINCIISRDRIRSLSVIKTSN